MYESENLSKDRMADIGAFFNEQSYEEYKHTGKVERTKEAVREFMEGYTDILRILQVPNFGNIYPNGFPLDLQFMISGWLNEIDKVQTIEVNPDNFQDRQILMYSYYLLSDEPYKEIFDIY